MVHAWKQLLVYVTACISGVHFQGIQSMLTHDHAVTRSVGIRAYGGEEKMQPMDKVAVSGVAGSTAGAVAGLARKWFRPARCSLRHLATLTFSKLKLQVARLDSCPPLSYGA